MSTQAVVAILDNEAGHIKAVVVCCDGYIVGGVGEMLKKHYNSQETVLELVNMCAYNPDKQELYSSDSLGGFYSKRNIAQETLLSGDKVKELGLTPCHFSSLNPTLETSLFNVNDVPVNLNFSSPKDLLKWAKPSARYVYLFKNNEWTIALGSSKTFGEY